MSNSDIERVEFEGKLLGIVVRSGFEKDGVSFFTPSEFSFQIGVISQNGGYVSKPHTHPELKKMVDSVMETVTVLKGKVKIKFYADKLESVKEVILDEKDSALFVWGGHGYEVIEKCKIFTVKQGPYPGPNLAKNYLN